MERGSVNHDVRITNGKIVTNLLFRSELMTKQELANKTGMSLPTVGALLKRLQECGLITQGSKQKSTGGRPASHILPVYSAAYSVGIFVSPNHVRICLTDLAPSIVAKAKYALPIDNTPEYWEQVCGFYQQFKKDFKVRNDKLLGIGIVMSTMPDNEKGVLTVLSGSKRIQVDTGYIYDAFSGLSIEIRNEAKMAALAQAWSNHSLPDFIYLSVNNNIAGAIVADREVVRYDSRNAEFGHMIIDCDGRPCVCGMRGCIDAYCSVASLQSATGLTLDQFFERLDEGDEDCLRIWDEYLGYFTIIVSNLHVTFDSDIVIGGIMSQHLTRYRDEIIRRIKEMYLPHSVDEFNDRFLHISDLGEYSSAVGAGLVFNDNFLSNVFN